jgi:hypothetical protein
MPKRKLENSKQRPAPASLTNGISAIRPLPEMTPPRLDCLARTERFELLNPETRGKRWGRLALNFHRRKEWTSAAIGASLSPCRDRAGWPIRDPAPLAKLPLWGFGGDGDNRKGSSNVARQYPQKDQVCAPQEPREKSCEAFEHSLGFDPSRRPSSPCSDSPRGQRSPPS